MICSEVSLLRFVLNSEFSPVKRDIDGPGEGTANRDSDKPRKGESGDLTEPWWW
ncbi:hypothetical protein N8611_01075 [bacterium]|nr:hypothetical protein [bacterium]